MLARIRERQGKPPHATAAEVESVRAYITAHPRHPGPRDEWETLKRFRERALSLASTLDEAHSVEEVPALVAKYLARRNLGTRAVCWPELASLEWAGSGLAVEARNARDDD